jgi:hypothetical protein
MFWFLYVLVASNVDFNDACIFILMCLQCLIEVYNCVPLAIHYCNFNVFYRTPSYTTNVVDEMNFSF